MGAGSALMAGGKVALERSANRITLEVAKATG